jgi:recombinational DNA repair protein RecR
MGRTIPVFVFGNPDPIAFYDEGEEVCADISGDLFSQTTVLNCKNCGAVVKNNKCEYCSTEY